LEPLMRDSETFRLSGKTVVYLAVSGVVAGLVAVGDPIKTQAKQAVAYLKSRGIDVVMLTGDSRATAQAVASAVAIEALEADVLPEAKGEIIKSLKEKGRKVAMAGDGINDAPALALADVGIAMGTGSDVALESAQIVLVKGDIGAIVRAHKLSKAMLKNIKQNLFFAFFYNALGVPVAAGLLYPFFGILLSPMIAGLAMSISSVCVIANALRLRGLKL
ncbi:MAG: HAD-IC family P-type ATPase, partial [Candidatus Obscuribacterales bacterium]|nr:HAD-IC family P-type ATPase [Candidatus Obscuribacterales bacterium]